VSKRRINILLYLYLFKEGDEIYIMNFETNSSSGDGDGYYSTLVDNEFIDFSANPLINGTIESFNGEMLPLKINNSNHKDEI